MVRIPALPLSVCGLLGQSQHCEPHLGDAQYVLQKLGVPAIGT